MNTKLPLKFTIHRSDIMRLSQAFTGSDVVLLALIRHETERIGYCHIDRNKHCKQLNMTEPTLRRSIKKLIKLGLIAKINPNYGIERQNGTVTYIYIPKTMKHPDEFLHGDFVRISEPKSLSSTLHIVEEVTDTQIKVKHYMTMIDKKNAVKIREAL